MAERAALAVVVHSGDFSRVHYALVLAAAAAAIDRPVRLFFTMEACRALRPPERLGGWAAPDRDLAAQGLATFEELLAACAELGVDVDVCELGLKAVGLAESDLRADVPISVGGAVTFLKAAGGGAQMLFV